MGGASEEVYVLSCGMCGIYWRATGWRGHSGALADGGEARVATDLIHGVKKNAPLYCEIGHCDHNDVLFMVVAFRGAEKSFIPLSERTAASTISLSLSLSLVRFASSPPFPKTCVRRPATLSRLSRCSCDRAPLQLLIPPGGPPKLIRHGRVKIATETGF